MNILTKGFQVNTLVCTGIVTGLLGIIGLVEPSFTYEAGQPHKWYTPWVYLAVGGLLQISGWHTLEKADRKRGEGPEESGAGASVPKTPSPSPLKARKARED